MALYTVAEILAYLQAAARQLMQPSDPATVWAKMQEMKDDSTKIVAIKWVRYGGIKPGAATSTVGLLEAKAVVEAAFDYLDSVGLIKLSNGGALASVQVSLCGAAREHDESPWKLFVAVNDDSDPITFTLPDDMTPDFNGEYTLTLTKR